MPQFATTRRVPYSAAQMFDLVADVPSYPQFVPLCEGMDIASRTPDGETEIVLARMTVAYGPAREAFTSRVVLDPKSLAIGVAAVDGPFRHLTNDWRFEPAGDRACDVHFAVDYEFRSRMLGMLFGAAFERGVRRFTEAFEERAAKVYG